jgi:crotonobetainyl-CoA:carnitine CoA-transferase CaiB-like acyl-CoA transferase
MAPALLELAANGSVPTRAGNRDPQARPHGVYRCAGEDDWISIVVTSDAEWQRLCTIAPALSHMARFGLGKRAELRAVIDEALSAWLRCQAAASAALELLRAGIPAAALASSVDLVNSSHLNARGFWETHSAGVLPGLPWRASFGRASGPAPELGADTERVLREVLALSSDEITALRQSGALG